MGTHSPAAAGASQEFPQGARSAGPCGQRGAVDQVESLGLREVQRRFGEAPVGDQDYDVTLVYGSSGAVEDMQVGGSDSCPGQAGAAVFALDDAASP